MRRSTLLTGVITAALIVTASASHDGSVVGRALAATQTNTISTAGKATAHAERLTPPAAATGTLPPGSALPTDEQCRARVKPMPEVRAVNNSYNHTVGTKPNSAYPRVTGNFTGTTDEIIQWVSCKWGIDADVVHAQIAKESWWHQDASGGDNGESFGLGQVRQPYHPTAFDDQNAIRSSAYNLDYTYAIWRSCFEGELTWLNTVERGATYAAGDMWGCLGVWFSGRWYTAPALGYIGAVKDYLSQRVWTSASFIAG